MLLIIFLCANIWLHTFSESKQHTIYNTTWYCKNTSVFIIQHFIAWSVSGNVWVIHYRCDILPSVQFSVIPRVYWRLVIGPSQPLHPHVVDTSSTWNRMTLDSFSLSVSWLRLYKLDCFMYEDNFLGTKLPGLISVYKLLAKVAMKWVAIRYWTSRRARGKMASTIIPLLYILVFTS